MVFSTSIIGSTQSNLLSTLSQDSKSFPMPSPIAYSDIYVKTRLVFSLAIATITIPYIILKGKEFYTKSSLLVGIAWAVAFLVNLSTVSLPGRYDNSNVSPEGGPWKSLFAPAPWAFIIWPVIYLLELITTLFIAFPTRNLAFSIIKKVLPWWIGGNLYQSLWCFSFRPVFQEYLWFPAFLLGCAAVSMLTGISIISKDLISLTTTSKSFLSIDIIIHALLRIPFSLHAGWLCAATLLNINGFASYKKIKLSSQLSLTYFSIYFAFILGTILTIVFKDPFLGFTFAWAIAGLAYQVKYKPSVEIDKVVLESLGQTEDIISKLLILIGITSVVAPKLF